MEQVTARCKRVLIISPYFPPVNAADMQRVRMSLSYYKGFGWEAEVVTVDPKFTDMVADTLLNQSVPADLSVHYVKALSKKWTAKIGLGSIALRSLYFYRQKVNQLIRRKPYDLIYFSTTQFPVCILGSYWKKKFGVPFIIDVQDMWHTEFYQTKPKKERPPKYWFSYRMNKFLEPIAMKSVDGLIAVSEPYLETLSERYPNCRYIPQRTITFGAFKQDFQIAQRNSTLHPSVLPKKKNGISIVYIGRGGADLTEAISLMFTAFKDGLEADFSSFSRIRFYFIGTSYAAEGKGIPTISPLARVLGISDFVTEITDRIPFYQTLNTLADASALFIPGSNDPQYTASKVYPYVMASRPLLALFHPASSVVPFLRSCNAGVVLTLDMNLEKMIDQIKEFMTKLLAGYTFEMELEERVLNNHTAKTMTQQQCSVFDEVMSKKFLHEF